MTTEAALRERIAAGVAWLDENEPDWRDRVDADRLNMGTSDVCVLGQLNAEDSFYCYLDSKDLDDTWARDHGFYLMHLSGDAQPGTGRLPYRELTELWREELASPSAV